MLLIGSNDLCTAMGIPGDLKSPKLRAAYEATAKACKAHNKHLGVGGIRPMSRTWPSWSSSAPAS